MALPFFLTLRQSLTPRGYRELRGATSKETFRYIALLLALGLLLKAIFVLPAIVSSVNELKTSSDHFSSASFGGALETTEPFLLPPKKPVIQVDTAEQAELEGLVLFTDTEMRYRLGEETKTFRYPDLSTPPAEGTVTRLILLAALILGPSLVFYAYLSLLVKVALVAGLLAGIAFLIGKARKDSRAFWQILPLALFSTTWIVLLESILVPLQRSAVLYPVYQVPGLTLYLVPLTLTTILFLIAYIGLGNDRYEFASRQRY